LKEARAMAVEPRIYEKASDRFKARTKELEATFADKKVPQGQRHKNMVEWEKMMRDEAQRQFMEDQKERQEEAKRNIEREREERLRYRDQTEELSNKLMKEAVEKMDKEHKEKEAKEKEAKEKEAKERGNPNKP
jgi:hypothetical protein